MVPEKESRMYNVISHIVLKELPLGGCAGLCKGVVQGVSRVVQECAGVEQGVVQASS